MTRFVQRVTSARLPKTYKERTMDRPIRILHLSDLHLDATSLRDQKVILRALFADIKRQSEKASAVDLVFFTGDLIAKGNYSAANVGAVQNEFLVPLIEATGIDPSRLLIIPGNHDINLKGQSTIIASAQKRCATTET